MNCCRWDGLARNEKVGVYWRWDGLARNEKCRCLLEMGWSKSEDPNISIYNTF